VRNLRPVANTADPRYRRTRAQICAATRRLLDTTDAGRLTFAQVAAAADVNRSTVHQHYASRHELVADALATDLAEITRPLSDCPFDRADADFRGDAHRDHDHGGDQPDAFGPGLPDAPPPAELVQMFIAARQQRTVLERLSGTDRDLLAARLTDLVAEQLTERFRSGARPAGFAAVTPAAHARYVAGGLVQLLLRAIVAEPSGAGTAGDDHGPERAAAEAWALIAPRRVRQPLS